MSCCGVKLEVRRNGDLKVTYSPRSKKFSFATLTPTFTVRRDGTTLLAVSGAVLPGGSSFVNLGPALVLTITRADLAPIFALAPETERVSLSYDVVGVDPTGFDNWLLGGDFLVLGINDKACESSCGDVEVSVDGQCVEISIEGGNMGAATSINLQALDEAVRSAESSASSAHTDAERAVNASVVAVEARDIATAKADIAVISADEAEDAREGAENARDQVERTLRPNDNPDWALVVVDKTRHHAGGWERSGRFRPISLYIPSATTVEGDEEHSLLERLVQAEVAKALGVLPTFSKWAFVINDRDGRIKFGIPRSGPIAARVTESLISDGVQPGGVDLAALAPEVVDRLSSNRYLAETTGSPPARRLFVNDRQTGLRTAIAATDPANPSIIDAAYVAYDAGGVRLYQPVSGGIAYPVYPERQLTLFGDSLTNSPLGVSAVGPVLGVSTVNRGSSGQGVADIAIRQGGLQPEITVAGGAIPASGGVEVTAIAPSTGYRVGAAYSFAGELAGVAGTLARSADDSWTFTRTAVGAATPCPPGSKFAHLTQSVAAQNDVQSLWAGRNNVSTATFHEDMMSCTELMVAYIKPLMKRFVVISVTNGTNEGRATESYSRIVNVNAALASKYGGYFYDLRTDFIQNGMTVAGIVPTSDDLAAIADDRPPPSLMADNIHPNTVGYGVQKTLFAAWLQQKGWFA